MADPLHQFQVTPLPGLDFGEVTLPVVGTVHLAFTNSHLAMTIAFLMKNTVTAAVQQAQCRPSEAPCLSTC